MAQDKENRKEYNTEQRKMLLGFLKENCDREFSVDTLARELGEISGGKIGKSTVYRQVKELCRCGLLRRFRKDGKNVVYQFMKHGDDCCNHFHLKCTGCGCLVHLECSDAENLAKHIKEKHNFNLDLSKTVLYGLCKECFSKSENKTGKEEEI